jgi:hypothetical protein
MGWKTEKLGQDSPPPHDFLISCVSYSTYLMDIWGFIPRGKQLGA